MYILLESGIIIIEPENPLVNQMMGELLMTYKTVVIDYNPKADKMAANVEKTANEMAKEGWNLVTFSVTNSAKAILVFCVS